MKSSTSRRAEQGGVLPVLLVLALLLAGGAYNYWRNLKAEPPRPYQHYADAEIHQLIAAYEGDIGRLAERVPAARLPQPGRGSSGALIGERVADFEAAQRRGEAHREAVGVLAGQEGVLRQLRKEREFRAGGPMGIHMRRLTTI